MDGSPSKPKKKTKKIKSNNCDPNNAALTGRKD